MDNEKTNNQQRIIDEIQSSIEKNIKAIDLLRLLGDEKRFERKTSDLIKDLMIETGNANSGFDNDQFADVLANLLQKEGINCSDRTISRWLNDETTINRNKTIDLCISLKADYEQTKEFLEQTGKDPFNYRNVEDAIYLYCIINKRPYSEIHDLKEAFYNVFHSDSPKTERVIDAQPHSGETTNTLEQFELGNWKDKDTFLNSFLIPNKDKFIGFSFNALKEFYHLKNNAFLEVITHLILEDDTTTITSFVKAYKKHENNLNLKTDIPINEDTTNCYDIASLIKDAYENKTDLQSILIISDFVSEILSDEAFLIKTIIGIENAPGESERIRNHSDFPALAEAMQGFPSKNTWKNIEKKGTVPRKSIILLFFLQYFYQIINVDKKTRIINSDFIIKLDDLLRKCRMTKIDMKNQFDYMVINCVNKYTFFDPEDYSNAIEFFNEVLDLANEANPNGLLDDTTS